MLIFPVALAMGVAVGYLLGGRLRHLTALELRAPVLVVAALGLQLAAGLAPTTRRFPIVLVSYVAVAAWLVVNASARSGKLRLAVGLLAAGWALNLAAIAANGGMPVSLHAARDVGARPGFDVTEGNLYKHVPASEDTRLSWLGDVVPVRPLASVISAGDVVMFLGLVLAVAFGMAEHRRQDRRPGAPAGGGAARRGDGVTGWTGGEPARAEQRAARQGAGKSE